MMLKELREKVYEANMDLPKHGLVVFTWGNASELDRESGLFVIKPSGVDYEDLSPESMVVCDLDGKVVEGDLNPSSDTATHAYLYQKWGDIQTERYISDRIVVMNHGQIMEQGPAKQIFEDPQDAYTKTLLGAAPSLLHPNLGK